MVRTNGDTMYGLFLPKKKKNFSSPRQLFSLFWGIPLIEDGLINPEPHREKL